jgi:mRNA interferase HigB
LHNAKVLIRGLAALEGFLKKNAAARAPMARWVAVAESADWRSIIDVRQSLPTADAIKGTKLTCFNIGGNSFRLLTLISYERQELVIHELMRHADYSRKYVR